MKRVILASVITIILVGFAAPAAVAGIFEYSLWTKNLSQDADPLQLFNHEEVKISVSGKYVHVVWLAYKRDFTGEKRLYYRRSIDGGLTFEAPRILVKTNPGEDIYFPGAWNSMVASGSYVHVFYRLYSPATISYSLNYLRSADQGKTFARRVWSNSGGYEGVYIAAAGAKVAVAWTTNASHASDLFCAYSVNGGAGFIAKQLAHDDTSDGKKVYYYSVHDMIRSGDYLYVLSGVTDENWFSSQSHLYLWGSNNGGQSFAQPKKVNLVASNGGYYARTIQAVNYTPNLAAKGPVVDVVWVNVDNPGSFDGWAAVTLRTRQSTNAGMTLAAPKTLYTFPAGYQHGAVSGLETIVRSGSNVYVSTTMQTAGHAGTYWWRRVDGGGWSLGKKMSDGGWWPQIGVTATKPTAVYAATGSYFTSRNSGLSFDGGVAPRYDFGDYRSPGLVIDDSGIPHYVWASEYSGYVSHEVLYRRLAPAGSPSAQNLALRMDKSIGDAPARPEYLQTAATSATNFSKTMTAEFWVRRDSDNWAAYENLLSKRRSVGESSFEIGAWDNFQIYGRIVTDQSANTYYGNWLGTGVTLARGVWTHVSMTYNANQAVDNWRIYVNGALKAKATVKGVILNDQSPLMLGDPNLHSLAGSALLVDELRLWSVARTATQIKADMRRKLVGNEAGLSLYYPFDKSFKDMTGRGNDAVPKYQEGFVTAAPFAY
jgi:hypothetical protein